MSSSHRLYCTHRPVPVAEVLEYVPASVCATCEAYADAFDYCPSDADHAVVLYIDGFSDTVPLASLEARLEDVSPM